MKPFALLYFSLLVLGLGGFASVAPVLAVAPADYNLMEGNLIRATGDADVFIINEHGYKRLFINPQIFTLYGHLGGWSAVKEVTPTARDAFMTSPYYRKSGDTKVYALEVTGDDTGVLHWVNMTGEAAVAADANFYKKIFTISDLEFNWYTKSTTDYTSLPSGDMPALHSAAAALTIGSVSKRVISSVDVVKFDETYNVPLYRFFIQETAGVGVHVESIRAVFRSEDADIEDILRRVRIKQDEVALDGDQSVPWSGMVDFDILDINLNGFERQEFFVEADLRASNGTRYLDGEVLSVELTLNELHDAKKNDEDQIPVSGSAVSGGITLTVL
jgi:hypothetical protein